MRPVVTDMQPLHDACRRGNLDSVEECLLNRIPVNLPDRSGNTPLHWAAHSGHTDCLNRLLAVPHIKLNATNRLGDTPLHQVREIEGMDSIPWTTQLQYCRAHTCMRMHHRPPTRVTLPA